MSVDFAQAAEDYQRYRPAFDPRLFERLRSFGVGLRAQRILDVGAGTGLFGQGLAKSSCMLVECDVSPQLLHYASATFRIAGRAEDLPFADHMFDAVTAAQSWHWFDRRRAPLELKRVLKPTGRLAIIYQMYLPIEGNVAHASEQLILKFRPGWRHAGGVGISGQALKDMQAAGFTQIESFSFDAELIYARENWQGFVRTCSAVAPTLSADELARFDDEHARLLLNWPEQFPIPHRIFAAVATRPIMHH